MGVLSHSSSDPTLLGVARLQRRASSSSSSLRKTVGSPAAAKKLIEDTLFVSHTDTGGRSQWEPFRFAHHEDGSVSFQPLRGSADDRPAADVFILNADWRQPFLAAPWKPVQWDAGGVAGGGIVDALRGATLFPFTLCYAPMEAKTGSSETAGSKRRTVMLAAADARTRGRWLAAFATKARSSGLRAHAPQELGEMPPTGTAATAKAPKGRRNLATLGDMHLGLPVAPSMDAGPPAAEHFQPPKPRLPPGRAELWEAKSSLRIVRDLYDGYAADPLAAASLPLTFVSDRSQDSAFPERRTSFLERYLERQAEIESILVQKLHPLPEATTACPSPDAEPPSEQSPDAPEPGGAGGEVEASEDAPSRYFDLLAKTPNVTLEDDVLSVAEWSGGALFVPPDEGSFMLTVCPLDPLDANPFFIGIAPRDADLGRVNFFVGGGVLLCLGGSGSGAFGTRAKAAAPSFHALGQTSEAQLPLPGRGGVVGVHYHEDGDGLGHVHFSVGDARGRSLAYARPKLRRPLQAGGWCPCVLLCAPGARIRVRRLA